MPPLFEIEAETEIEVIRLRRFRQFSSANPSPVGSHFSRKGPFSCANSAFLE